MTTPPNPGDEIREVLAEAEHLRWVAHLAYIFGRLREAMLVSETGPPETLRWYISFEDHEKWTKDMVTPFAELPESEKEQCRAVVDAYLPAVVSALKEQK